MLGVFTAYGAFVDSVINRGPVTTYGPKDMVLDTVDAVLAFDQRGANILSPEIAAIKRLAAYIQHQQQFEFSQV